MAGGRREDAEGGGRAAKICFCADDANQRPKTVSARAHIHILLFNMNTRLEITRTWLCMSLLGGPAFFAAGCSEYGRASLGAGRRAAPPVIASVDLRGANMSAMDASEPARAPTPAARSSDAGTGTMLVESEPSGAQVVIGRTPVGKTPCRLLLDVSPAGFCKEAFFVKVRFVAGETGAKSQTVEEHFTKLDKIPAKLRVTQEGATRVWDGG